MDLFHNYIIFKRAMTRTFGDIDEVRTMKKKLMRLTQKRSAINYASLFQQYAAHTEWDDAAQTAQFYRGLKDAVKNDVSRSERPASLQGMINLAVKIDNRQYERKLER
jgi:hypothetical protein